jgi:hypothetical protein
MGCNTDHKHSVNRLDWLEASCRRTTGGNTLLYFMSDFGRARLWSGAMKLAYLAPRLHELNTTVVLVGEAADGDDVRITVAARLAEELGLPFPLIADSQHTLWRQYATGSVDRAGKRAGVILVDGCGQPVGSWSLQAPEQTLDLRGLLDALHALEALPNRRVADCFSTTEIISDPTSERPIGKHSD